MKKKGITILLASAMIITQSFVPYVGNMMLENVHADEIAVNPEKVVENNSQMAAEEETIDVEEFTTDDGLEYKIDENENAIITGYSGDEIEIEIPSIIGEHKVRGIGGSAFYSKNEISKIILPDTIEYIGNGAFSSCGSLININLPSSVKEIGDNAFYYCSNLKDIELPDNLESIGNNAFSYCKFIKEIDIPALITKIPSGCFSFCTSLKEVDFEGDKISVIESSAFQGCSALKYSNIEKLTNLKKIGGYAFKSCISLEEVLLPDSVTFAEEYAFDNCNNLQKFKLSNGMSIIKKGMIYCGPCHDGSTYYDYGNYTYKDRFIFIPKSIEAIEEFAFTSYSGYSDKGKIYIYYGGAEAEWEDINNSDKINSFAKIICNSSLEDFYSKAGADGSSSSNEKKDDPSNPEIPDNPSVPDYPNYPDNPSNPDKSSDDLSKDKKDTIPEVNKYIVKKYGKYYIDYTPHVAFNGKKFSIKNFGTIYVSYGGYSYKVKKIKINKKTKTFQITKLNKAYKKDKSYKLAQKAIKKLTAGETGLPYYVSPYTVTDKSTVFVSFNKSNGIKSVTIIIDDKKYKCKKSEYTYDSENKVIIFNSENLKGRYSVG